MRETGVSVAFTVRAMDAGPVLAQERVRVDADVQAPELLRDLFKRGTRCGMLSSPPGPSPEAGPAAHFRAATCASTLLAMRLGTARTSTRFDLRRQG